MQAKRILIVILLSLVGSFGVVATAHGGPLYPAQTYEAIDLAPTGGTAGGVMAIVMNDVNGDGHLDILTSNSVHSDKGPLGSVSVLLGNGDGTFQPPVGYALGATAQAIAMNDFNGDGQVDIAVTSFYGNNVSVLLGNEDGTFQEQQASPAGSAPEAIAVADVNGNGVQDILVANNAGAVSVLLGNGDATFQAPQTFDVQTSTLISIAAMDFNGDGYIDVAVTGAAGGQDVSVLFGNGDGSFQPSQNFTGATTGYDTTMVAAADIDADGFSDLVVSSHDISSDRATGKINVLMNNGDGSFQAPVAYGTGTHPRTVTLADVNGDDKLDIVTPNDGPGWGLDGSTTSVLLGNGDGTFQPEMRTGITATGIWASAVGDVNDDGHPDVVNANAVAPGTVTVMLGRGDGSFQTQNNYILGDTTRTNPRKVVTADFNGDGYSDIVTAGNSTSILISNGDGTYKKPVEKPLLVTGVVAASDVNGDDMLDIVVASANADTRTGEIAVFLGLGDGTFQTPLYSPVGPPITEIIVSDVNGDGNPDVAAVPAFMAQRQVIAVLLGNGDGTFQAAKSYAAGARPEHLAVMDLNDDGTKDVVVTNRLEQSTISVLLGNGDGSFQAPQSYATEAAWTNTLAVFDADNDGIYDVVTSTSKRASIMSGNGDGYFQPPQKLETGRASGFSSATAADVTGDGYSDIIFTATGDNAVVVLPSGGDGNFLEPGFYAVGYGPASTAIGDANDDGLPDIFVGNASGKINTVGVLLHLAVNEPPVADDGTLTTEENQSASGTLKAQDPDGGELTFSIVDQPAHGSVSLEDASSGSYSYTPNQDYVGPDSFTFKANDGEDDSNVATVTITVKAVEPPPDNDDGGGGGMLPFGLAFLALLALVACIRKHAVSRRATGPRDC